eukprot:CAMPEP_0181468468 /NCGR_PEP_ID=MMETSP1110-20121109/37506_1 /TAXON_ID=174948 /ORGANISM="Symbiodinium sp., Strain CCMP421" /LENGTH=835 /DNA_ID=CAMNT_0023593319 /DNA_START=99 /DNA_END=2604 /DNA_ORIENTATION=+
MAPTTVQVMWALWEEVGAEAVLLLCFCLGFFVLRLCQMRARSAGKKQCVYEPERRQPARLSLEDSSSSWMRKDEALRCAAQLALPGSHLVWLFQLLARHGAHSATDKLLALPSGCLSPKAAVALAQHAASAAGGLEVVRQVQRLLVGKALMSQGASEALLRGYALNGAGTEEAAQLLRSFPPSEAALSSALSLCAAKGAVTSHAELLARGPAARKLTLPIAAGLLKVYGQAKLWGKACNLCLELRAAGIQPDTATYGALIKAAVEAGRQELAQQLFQESGNPDVMNVMSMIRSAGRERDVKKALELLEALEAASPEPLDATTYNCALEACVAASDRASAEQLLRRMARQKAVDVVSYNTFIKLLLSSKLHGEVRDMLQEMRDQGISPNVVTYNSIIKEAAIRDMDTAWQLAEEMQSLGLRPDVYTASILVAGLRKEPRGPSVGRVLQLMTDSHIVPDEVLLNCLLDVCIRLKEPRHLGEVLDRWKRKGLPPSPHACVMLMRAHGHALRMDEAWALWRQLLRDDRALTEDIFMSMVDACLASSDLHSLLRVFQEARRVLRGFPRATVAFSLATKAAVQLQQLDMALELYEETREVLRLSLVTYNTLIDALVRGGDLKRAMDLFRDMALQDAGPDLITFSILIKGFSSAGDLETAIMLLGQMQSRGIYPDSILFNSILHGCAKRQRRALTEEVLADMERAGVSPSNFTLSILIKLYGRCGDLEAAFALLERRYDFQINAQVYTCLMSTCIWSGDLPRALEVYERMLREKCPADTKTFATLLQGCVRHGDPGTALRVLRAALPKAQLEKDSLDAAVLMAQNRSPEIAQEMLELLRAAG